MSATYLGPSYNTLKKMRKEMGLLSTRQQKQNLASALPALKRVRKRFPKAGMRDLRTYTFREEGLKVTRAVIEQFFKEHEPEGIKQRKAKRLKRKHFWAAGVNDIWAIDQHDKFKRFNLWLHTGVEPYSGQLLWLKVWWTNKNPRLILHYYLDKVLDIGAIPLVTQSDPGSENYGVANAHTALRQLFDPSLQGTRQHRFMRGHTNVKPEISWNQMRRRFTPGFEDILDKGLNNGWYDPNDPLDMLLFRWLFVPWLQAELNAWMQTHNATPKRADKNKILPHGRPQLIFEAPDMFFSLDFKVGVTPEAVHEVREHYAPSDDPLFQLVPPAFDILAQSIYNAIGNCVIERDTIWEIYKLMLVHVRQIYTDNPSPALDAARMMLTEQVDGEPHPEIALTKGLRELRNGDAVVGTDGYYYMGGVDKGYAGFEDDLATLDIGGGVSTAPTTSTSNATNYPAAAAIAHEDDTAGSLMPIAAFSDDEDESFSDEW